MSLDPVLNVLTFDQRLVVRLLEGIWVSADGTINRVESMGGAHSRSTLAYLGKRSTNLYRSALEIEQWLAPTVILYRQDAESMAVAEEILGIISDKIVSVSSSEDWLRELPAISTMARNVKDSGLAGTVETAWAGV